MRGTEVNARLGGVPKGKPLINTNKASVFPNCHICIVVQLPPRGAPTANNRLYRIAVIGRGFHGLLTSPTTHIPGSSRSSTSRRPRWAGIPRRRSPGRRRQHAVGQLSRLGQRDRREQPAQVRGPLHPRRTPARARAARPARSGDGGPGGAARQPRARDGPGLERGAPVRRRLGRNRAPRARARAPLPQRVGAPRALRRSGRAVRVRHGHPTRVAGGEPVRPDAELALLGDRQPGRDAAARAAARGGVPRASPLRDRRLRRSSASSVSS